MHTLRTSSGGLWRACTQGRDASQLYGSRGTALGWVPRVQSEECMAIPLISPPAMERGGDTYGSGGVSFSIESLYGAEETHASLARMIALINDSFPLRVFQYSQSVSHSCHRPLCTP